MKTYFDLSVELTEAKKTLVLSTTSIYCDMDQVLVNFLSGARRSLGKEFNDSELGSNEDKWKLLSVVPEFWIHLDWMPGAKNLWNRLRKYDCHILSACPEPSIFPSCPTQKREWCKRNLTGIPAHNIHTVQREDKQQFAMTDGEPNLLIDDHPRNASEWRKAGGIVILHTTVPETMSQLTHLGFV